MSEQLTPVIRYAFENDRLTSAWGTIRGNTLELSLTVQAARPADIPQEWYETLPNNVPALLPVGEEYDVPRRIRAHRRRTPLPGILRAAGSEEASRFHELPDRWLLRPRADP